MKNNAKRVLGLLLCVLMCVSMFTVIVLPASAEVTAPVSASNPYAKVTTVEGSNKPTANVYFFDAAWATAPAAEGAEFSYTYAGNGETYTLTWGKNAFATMADCMAQMQAYATDWAADTEMSSDFVAVFAPGNYGGNTIVTAVGKDSSGAMTPTFTDIFKLTSRAGSAVPTPDQLLNVYMLGAKAGKNPVNDKRDDKASAKLAQNGRSVSTDTESVIADTFILPKNSNFTLDGFAGSVAACITTDIAADQYINISIENYFVRDLTTPMANMMFYCYDGGGGKPADVTWNFKNCFFDINKEMNSPLNNYNYNQITANKIIFDNCAFLHATPSTPNVTASREPNGHTLFLLPTLPNYAASAAAFLGDYATSPEITIKDCIVADWATVAFFRIGSNNNRFRNYWDNKNQVKVNIVGNKFYDYGVDHQRTASIIQFSKWTNPASDATNATKEAEALVFNVQGNLFSASDELGADPDKKRFTQFFDFGSDGKDNSAANAVYSELKHFTIKENIFRWPNAATNAGNYIFNPFYAQYPVNVNVDLSANLFIDNQNHVIANGVRNFRHNAFRIQSDAYVSAAMEGGVRETFYVKDIKGGAVLYNYIQLEALYHASYRKSYLDDFIGAVTVLLERGKEYTADETLFTFGSDKVVFDGVYSDEACTKKVNTLTQEMFDNNIKYFLKAHYTETANGITTTATVRLALNSPKEYIIIAPEGSEYATNGSYTFNGITYTNGATAEDGVAATFSTKLDGTEIGWSDTVYAENYVANDSSQTATANTGTVFGLQSMIVLTPGTVGIGAADYLKGSKSVAIVGPQWNASPYGAENANGELANDRSVDGANEARLPISFRNNNSLPNVNYSFHGVVFCHNEYGAMVFNTFVENQILADDPTTEKVEETKARTAHSDYESLIIKNCVFDTQSTSFGLVGGYRNTYDTYIDGEKTTLEQKGLTLDIRVQDSVYAGTNQTKIPGTFFAAEASRKVIENFAVLTQNCVPENTLLGSKYEEPVCNWKTDSSTPTTSGITWYAVNHAKNENIVVDQEPTCYQTGSGHYNCICGKNVLESNVNIPATNEHIYATEWTQGTDAHYHVCTTSGCTARDAEAAHTVGELIVDEEAGCNNGGKGHKNCSVCDVLMQDNIDIEATGEHVADDELVIDEEPSCYEQGVAHSICKFCRTTLESNVTVDATNNHVYATEWTQGTDTHYHVCTTSGCTAKDDEIAHQEKLYVNVPATCGDAGNGKYACEICDATIRENVVIQPTGEHVLGEPEMDKGDEASCDKNGKYHIDCVNCGEVMDTILLPATHTPGEWTVLQPGKEGKLCTKCGAVLEIRNVLPEGSDPVVKPEPSADQFKDIKKGDWYYNAVDYAVKNDLFKGISETEFGPNVKMSRAMFVTVLGRLHGIESTKATTKFTDVDKEAYYSDYVAWAAANNIVSGTSTTQFSPNANITREQICVIMYRYCDYAGITLKNVNSEIIFTDAGKISSWAKQAVAACQRGALVNGKDGGKFDPLGSATRAEVATILMNFSKNYK